MKVGNVIKNKHGLCVITQIENGQVVASEHIDDFICDNAVVVDSDGEHRTIREIIEERKKMYLAEYKAIKE